MILSKEKNKSAIMFISKSNNLNKWETKTKHILNLPIVNHYKYLGVVLNKKLEPKQHIEKLELKM